MVLCRYMSYMHVLCGLCLLNMEFYMLQVLYRCTILRCNLFISACLQPVKLGKISGSKIPYTDECSLQYMPCRRDNTGGPERRFGSPNCRKMSWCKNSPTTADWHLELELTVGAGLHIYVDNTRAPSPYSSTLFREALQPKIPSTRVSRILKNSSYTRLSCRHSSFHIKSHEHSRARTLQCTENQKSTGGKQSRAPKPLLLLRRARALYIYAVSPLSLRPRASEHVLASCPARAAARKSRLLM